MKTNSRTHLKQYNNFLNEFRPKELWVFNLGTTTQRYLYLAEIQLRNFKENLVQSFNKDASQIDYTERCYSYCYGFYALIRTSLEASRRLSNEMAEKDKGAELQEYRNSQQRLIKPIIKISNDIIKHPLADKSRNKKVFYQPGGLDSTGKVSIYEWSLEKKKDLEVFEIHPTRDFDTTYEHLEGLGVQYLRILKM